MRLSITIDIPEAIALELVPEGSLGTYGTEIVEIRLQGRLMAMAMGKRPRDIDVLGGRTIDAQLTRELTRAERISKIDAEYFDEELL